jgi:2-amino-4-hydroxy-6-hydroxymethyldihydropteridine diphosphokinase
MPEGMSEAWIALGGNLGDREDHFAHAIKLLGDHSGVSIERGSPVYETPPIGPAGQERYWNAVIEVKTSLDPAYLLASCLEVERKLGRMRDVRWGPRTIDLDVLLFGELVVDDPELTLPHPRLHERAFALRPLADLVPRKSLGGKTVIQWLGEVSEDGMVRVKDSVLACR